MTSRFVSSSVALIYFGLLVGSVEPHRHYHSKHRRGMCAAGVAVHGYKCKEFEVKTKDGYILSMQRIPEGRKSSGANVDGRKKQPVLVQHGVFVDGLAWAVNSPDQSLPFVLADNGFDVWIANTRGTRFSRKHANLDPHQPEYWDWSWDELADYDLPATIDFVHRQTGQKIHYVGHSMGTLVVLASLSQGKLVDKLKSAALLSPVAYLSNMKTPIGVLAAKLFIGEMTDLLGIPEFNPTSKTVHTILDILCDNPGINCYDLLTLFTGKNCCLNASTVKVFLKHEPQSTSTKNMIHLAQTVRDGILAKYDYVDEDSNMEHYGQSTPPEYNLADIPRSFPLFISHGGEDVLSDTGDVSLLLDKLKLHDGDKKEVQFVKHYAHADFIMGVTAKEIVYNPLIKFFRRQWPITVTN